MVKAWRRTVNGTVASKVASLLMLLKWVQSQLTWVLQEVTNALRSHSQVIGAQSVHPWTSAQAIVQLDLQEQEALLSIKKAAASSCLGVNCRSNNHETAWCGDRWRSACRQWTNAENVEQLVLQWQDAVVSIMKAAGWQHRTVHVSWHYRWRKSV